MPKTYSITQNSMSFDFTPKLYEGGNQDDKNIEDIELTNVFDTVVNEGIHQCSPSQKGETYGKKIVNVQSAKAFWIGTFRVLENSLDMDVFPNNALLKSLKKIREFYEDVSDLANHSIVFSINMWQENKFEYFELRQESLSETLEPFTLINICLQSSNNEHLVEAILSTAKEAGFALSNKRPFIKHSLFETADNENTHIATIETLFQRLIGSKDYSPETNIETLAARQLNEELEQELWLSQEAFLRLSKRASRSHGEFSLSEEETKKILFYCRMQYILNRYAPVGIHPLISSVSSIIVPPLAEEPALPLADVDYIIRARGPLSNELQGEINQLKRFFNTFPLSSSESKEITFLKKLETLLKEDNIRQYSECIEQVIQNLGQQYHRVVERKEIKEFLERLNQLDHHNIEEVRCSRVSYS